MSRDVLEEEDDDALVVGGGGAGGVTWGTGTDGLLSWLCGDGIGGLTGICWGDGGMEPPKCFVSFMWTVRALSEV